MTLYGSKFIDSRATVSGREVPIDGLERPGVVTQEGMYLYGRDGRKLLVTQLQLEDGRTIPAHKWGVEEKVEKLELTEEEERIRDKIIVGEGGGGEGEGRERGGGEALVLVPN